MQIDGPIVSPMSAIRYATWTIKKRLKKRKKKEEEWERNLNDEPTGLVSNIISCIPQKSAHKEVVKSVEKDFLKLKLLTPPPPPPTPPVSIFSFDHSFQFNLNQILWCSRQVVPVDLSLAPNPPSPTHTPPPPSNHSNLSSLWPCQRLHCPRLTKDFITLDRLDKGDPVRLTGR